MDYPVDRNRVVTVTRASMTIRSFTYDAAGNLLSDVRPVATHTYTYNHAGRLTTVTIAGTLRGTYTYNGLGQLIHREVTNSGTANGTYHTVQDRNGNVIADLDGSGATVREYIWLPDAGLAGLDLPVAVVADVPTTKVTYAVHADHLGRPIRMTDASKATVWQATWEAWGGGAPTGSATLDARFPGQWFQVENGLRYNWHRQYDVTLGRYIQPDPARLADGPSLYGYARQNPMMWVDPEGLWGIWNVTELELAGLPGGVLGVIRGWDSDMGFFKAYYGGTSLGAGGSATTGAGFFSGNICDFAGIGAGAGGGGGPISLNTMWAKGFVGFSIGCGGGSPFSFGAQITKAVLDPKTAQRCACRNRR